jgi:3-dehydroquinate dehydratase-2
MNPGAYTHTSIALHDAIKSITVPVIEIHLSNPHTREAFRHKSYVGMAAKGTIAGFCAMSYMLALEAALEL